MRPSLRSLWLPLLTLLFFINSKDAAAQIYPVQVTVQAIPPYPIYLRDFAAPTAASDRIRLQLLLTDLNVPSRQVRLKMKLSNTSGGAVIQNGDVVSRALPIQLTGGIPLYLGSADLDPYFSPDNLPGLPPTAYTQALPEGVYQLCFEIFDYISGERLSRSTCFTLSIVQNDPPLLSLPRNHEAVAIANPQSLLFQWTPRAIGASAVEYEFTLVEQLDSLLPPQVAVLSPPLYQVTTYATSLYLGPLDAPLQPGHRYCWRVQAKARAGTETIGTFKNNGYSEVWAFRVTDANCTAPTGLIAIEQGKRSLKLGWTALADLTPSYRLSYRVHESSSVNGGTWYDRPASTNSLQIFDLDPATEYEVRVGRPCTGGDYLYSNSIYVSTRSATDSTANASCGLPPNPVDVSNTSPLTTLSPAEKFTAGDFEVTAVEVTGGSGTYSGKGYITVPYLANAKVKVKWDGIRLNSDRKLVQGMVETTWDPTMHGITNIDAVFNGGSGMGSVVTGTVATDYHTSFEIGGAGDFSFSGTDDNPVITIADHNNDGGSGLIIPAGPLPVSVSDPSGDVYVVETGADGHPVVVHAATPVPLAMTAAQLNTLSPDKGKVVFARGAATQYGFDAYRSEYEASTAWSSKYEALGTAPVYRVPAKATLAGKPDRIVAQVSLNDAALVADSVQFITGKGLRYTSRPLPGGSYEVLLVGSAANDAQEVYSLYPKRALQGGTAADSGKYLSLGKVLVAGYAPVTAKVVLVPVNGATIDSAAVRTELAKAYNPIGIKWEVQQSAPWTDSSWDADHNGKLKVTGTSGWAVYTDEMDALNAAYKASHTLVSGAAYLFVLPGVADNSGVAAGGDVAGDMPRGKRFGYLFAGALNGTTGRVAAHELGHGVLKLMHTFDNAYGFGEGALGQNLMSYGGGDSLGKVQWDAAHAPGLVVGVWEGEQDGQTMSIVPTTQRLPKEFLNADSASYTFITPAGKAITLPKSCYGFGFLTDLTSISEYRLVTGSLMSFWWNGRSYVYQHQYVTGDSYSDNLNRFDSVLSLEPTSVIMSFDTHDGLKVFKIAAANISKHAGNESATPLSGERTFPVRIFSTANPILYTKSYNASSLTEDERTSLDASGETPLYLVDQKRMLMDRLYPDLGIKFVFYPTGKWQAIKAQHPEIAALENTNRYEYECVLIDSLAAYIKEEDSKNQTFLQNLTFSTPLSEVYLRLLTFSTPDFESLSYEQRKLLLQICTKEGIVNSPDLDKERVVLSLITTTPESSKLQLLNDLLAIKDGGNNYPSLLAALTKDVYGLDGDNYRSFVTWLFEGLKQYKPCTTNCTLVDALVAGDASTRKIIDFKPGFWTGHGFNEWFTNDNRIKLFVHPLFTADKTIYAAPYEYVFVTFRDDYTLGDHTFHKGQALRMPAYIVYALFNEENDKRLIQGGKLLLDVGLMAVGVGEVSATYKALRATQGLYEAYKFTTALADVGMGITDLYIEFGKADEWSRTPDGQQKLAFWHKVQALYAVGRITTSVVEGAVSNVGKGNGQIENDVDFAKFKSKLNQSNTDEEIETMYNQYIENLALAGNSAIGQVTKSFVKNKLPTDFVNALKSFGKSEDEIFTYFMNYHNENGFRFFNEIDACLFNNIHNLTTAEAYALWGYTTNFYYRDLNFLLRNGNNSIVTQQLKSLINGAASKLTKYEGVIYRGIEISNIEDFIANYREGTEQTWNDFTSCGSSKAASFADRPTVNVVFEINHLDGKDISIFADGIRYRGKEPFEILIKSGSKFEVLQAPFQDPISGKWIIRLAQTY